LEINTELIKEHMRNKNLQIFLVCLLVLFLNIFDVPKGELFYNNDEPRHAFNGVFIYDLIKDLPSKPLVYKNKRDVKRRKNNISLKMLTLGGKEIGMDFEERSGP
jgi:hypothetical protein